MKLWDRLRKWIRPGDAAHKEKPGSPDTKSGKSRDAQREAIERNLKYTRDALLNWAAFSYLLILLYGLSFWFGKPDYEGFTEFVAIFSKGSLLALAFASIGALFGFIFGIPITQGASEAKAPESGASAGSTPPSRKPRQKTNTSVEQISDWLTKILVGVGLTQLDSIPGKLGALGAHFAPALGGTPAVPLIIILNFSVSGFFAGYLLTRLFLEKAFDDAMRALEEAEATKEAAQEEARKKVEEVSAKMSKALQVKVSPIAADAGAEAQKERNRKRFEDLIFTNLYEAPPDGFTKAIKNAEESIQQEGAGSSDVVLAYLAMAYGQQYQWEKEHERRRDVLDDSRNKAFEFAQMAIKGDPEQKSLLRRVWDPKTAIYDDDLVVFYDDPEFKKLLG